MAERQTGRKLKVLRTDNGTEYVNSVMKMSMQRDGVIHQTTCPYTPEQNGTAERMNRTLVEKARSMMNDVGLPKKFWAEAVSTAAYIVNRCPTRALEFKTPEEAWSQKKPNLKHLRVFGSQVMVHCPKQKRQKFDPKSVEGIFIGYAENSKGFRVYDQANDEVIISRDVVFINEERMFNATAANATHQPVEFMELYTWQESDEQQSTEPDAEVHPGPSTEAAVAVSALPPQQDKSADEQHGLRRSGRERQLPGKYADFKCFSSITGPNDFTEPMSNVPGDRQSETQDDPNSYAEVLKRPDREQWSKAMCEEIQALEENETWVLTDLPEGRKAIRNKWVFKTKRGPDGKIERFKARLVVKGCSQRYGVDFDEVYAPVVRYSTIRYLMSLAAQYDLDVDQMDAVTAFLQGKLTDEVIYMEQPEGFILDSTKVCLLKRALYGLKQSSRVWNLQLDEALKQFGLERSSMDPCLYFKIEGCRMLFVTIYVDDFLLFTNDQEMKKKLKAFLNSRFKMKDLGEAKFCLGLKITRDRSKGKLWLDQQHYVQEVLERFNLANCNPVSTPADVSAKLDKSMCPTDPEEIQEMQSVPYKAAVGSLTYIAQATRPDIAFAVNMVSQFSSNPGRRHWESVKRIMRYLKGTSGNRLEYSQDGNPQLTGYTDADWGGDADSRKSTTGYVFSKMGGAISWNCKRQEVVALSTCEAEYIALSRTTQEALWWQQLLEQFNGNQSVPIRCDNQSAICVARNQGFNPRTKHICSIESGPSLTSE